MEKEEAEREREGERVKDHSGAGRPHVLAWWFGRETEWSWLGILAWLEMGS